MVAKRGQEPPRRAIRDPCVGREAAAVEDLASVAAGRLALPAHRSTLGAGYERMRKDSWTSAPFSQIRDRRKVFSRVMDAGCWAACRTIISISDDALPDLPCRDTR